MKTKIMTILLMCFVISGYTQISLRDISFENYPRVDGSTSTMPLNKIIACKFLNIGYEWSMEPVGVFWSPNTKYEFWMRIDDSIKQTLPFNNGKIKASQTHQAFINLIENKADIILAARKISEEEQKYADSLGIQLIETPVAIDALIFLVNKERRVKSLTTKQIQDIYRGNIDRWEAVGGDSTKLYPLIRTANSGSQELMENIVMQGLTMPWNEKQIMERIVHGMPEVFMALSGEQPQAICFSVYYYKEMMIRDLYPNIQTLAINGIEPNRKTLSDKTYPYVAEVYAIIRSDLQKNDLAYQLYEWLQTEEGRKVIEESGYIPIKN